MKKILYIQFTNPADIPPLERGACVLAQMGWQVRFYGICYGRPKLIIPATHAFIYQLVKYPEWFKNHSLTIRLAYLYYAVTTVILAAWWRPAVVYASDLWSVPIAFILKKMGWVVAYHEHDDYSLDAPSLVQKMMKHFRRRLSRKADAIVCPNAGRLARFKSQTDASAPCFVVWNVPLSSEVATTSPADPKSHKLNIIYTGSITPERLPETLLSGMGMLEKGRCELGIVGFESPGSRGYLKKFLATATHLGLEKNIKYHGPVPHYRLKEVISTYHIGVNFMPMITSDSNVRMSAGASNKAFEYLACGIPVLVSDLADWRALFVDAGLGRCCDPGDPVALARQLEWFRENPSERVAMGVAGQKRIMSEWNYEKCFRPVVEHLNGIIASC